MYKKLAAVAAMVLLLAGCSAPQVETTPTPTAEAATPEEAFIAAFRDSAPAADRGTDAQWLAVGESVCEALDAGASPNQVIDQMNTGNVSAEEAASLVVNATDILCPEYAP